jgi:hypothetical protein
MSPEPTEDVAPTRRFARTAAVQEGFTGNRNSYARQGAGEAVLIGQFPETRLYAGRPAFESRATAPQRAAELRAAIGRSLH